MIVGEESGEDAKKGQRPKIVREDRSRSRLDEKREGKGKEGRKDEGREDEELEIGRERWERKEALR